MNMEEYCQNRRLMQGEYKFLDKLYPKKLLDPFFANLKIYPDDFSLMDKVYGQLRTSMHADAGVDEDLLREALLIAVMANDPGDAEFIRNNPDCCQKCGFCCRNCDPIIVRQDEIAKIGSTEHLRKVALDGGADAYAMKRPCPYLLPDNSCGNYKNRPDSCKNFPVGIRQGQATVQRSVHCGLIEVFLVHKTAYLIDMLYKKINQP